MANDITITGRIMYPHVHTPHQFKSKDGKVDDPAYRCTIVIPQNDPQIAKINAIAEQLIASELDGVRPTAENWILKIEADNPNCAGHLVIRPKSPATQKPNVVDGNLKPIMDPGCPADGDNCAFSIRLFAYITRGNKGISAALNGVMFMSQGQGRLGKTGPPSVQEQFGSMVGQAPPSQQPVAQQPIQPQPGQQPGGFGF